MKSSLPCCLLLVIVFISCGSKHSGEVKPTLASHFLNISDNEDKGIKDIIAIYGGECKYGVSKLVGVNAEKKNTFWLEVSNSNEIDNTQLDIELIGSNIAYLFYRNLKEEKHQYSDIQVRVTHTGGETRKYSFPVATLETVTKRREVVDKIYDYVRLKDFKSLSEHLQSDTAVSKFPKEQLLYNLMQVESKHSPPKELIPYGFHFIPIKDGRQILYIAGIMLRQNGNEKNPFVVILDPASSDDKIYGLTYDFKL